MLLKTVIRELFGMKFDLIWDRASFVALNVEDRTKSVIFTRIYAYVIMNLIRYISILSNLMAPDGKWFLVTVDYDDKVLGGRDHPEIISISIS
jgi:hypothetical protein